MRTIVHLSDVHVGRLDPAIVEPLVASVRSIRPDLVALSGDLTQRARPAQFREARRIVDALGCRTLAVPGNHDVPLWNVAARFVTPFARYRRYIAPDLEPMYRDDEVIVLGVNTARSFAWGEGRINRAQVRSIVERLAEAPRSLVRIIVTHHPFDLPPGVGENRLLGRAHTAMASLASAGADLFLAGHLHISHIGHSAERYRIAQHSALIVQAGTVSMRARGEHPTFNVLHIERDRIAVSRFAWNPAASTFAETASGSFTRSETGWKPVPVSS
jgi:3',5'-cyclic AMP phosphodiesterase CpdA